MSALRRGGRRDLGLGLVETLAAFAAAALLFAAGIGLTKSAGDASRGVARRTSLAVSATNALDRLERDLQVAGFLGEDVNGNGLLDPDEDVNRNLRLDADWSLGDGRTDGAVTMNLVERDWTWSGPVSWTVRGGSLVRTRDGVSVEVCRNVQAFSVARSSAMLTIRLTMSGADGAGASCCQAETRRIHVRN